MNISRNLFLSALVVCAFPAVASEVAVEAVPTFCSKAVNACKSAGSAFFYSPVTFLDFVAKNGGAVRFAEYLGTVKDGAEAGFFANNKVATSRAVAFVMTAATVLAAYKAWQSFAAQNEDVDAGDEYDFGVYSDEDVDFDAEDAE